MLYIIGLGLNEKGISKEGLLILEKCKKVYLEGYTIDFPYDINELKLGKKIEVLERKDVESNRLIKEAKSIPIALLVYGCPLFATTHISLVLDAQRQGVKTRIVYSASVFDAIAESGLQLYKFGKISSMPAWRNNYEPDSFLDFVEQNLSIKAHSLILVDIGLHFKKALVQLEMAAQNKRLEFNKIIVCSKLGTEESRIFYATTEILRKKEIEAPFCFIIPSELHFLEQEALGRFGCL
jgi:diphthine synthase